MPSTFFYREMKMNLPRLFTTVFFLITSLNSFVLPAAAMTLTDKLSMLVNKQFHLEPNDKVTFYDFPIKEKERYFNTEQELTIKGIEEDKYGIFYKVALSKERYVYYIDALLFYDQRVGRDGDLDILIEKEKLARQKREQREKELEKITALLSRIVNHQFRSSKAVVFYFFPTKGDFRHFGPEREISIKGILTEQNTIYYDVSISGDPYHYYIDALSFYSALDNTSAIDIFDNEDHALIKREIERLSDTLEHERRRVADIDQRAAEEARLKEAEKRKIRTKLSEIETRMSGFKGHDIQIIYKQYHESISGKKEFEKTSDFRKRLKASNHDQIYTFLIDKKNGLKLEYDADSELLNAEIDGTYVGGISDVAAYNSSFMVLKTTNEKTSTYIGSNAFGAKKVITKYTGKKYGVQVADSQELPMKFSLKLSPSEAKKHKGNIKAVLICKSYIKEDKLAITGYIYEGPTFDSPTEISYTVDGINIELLEVWLYDSNSGKIFLKKSFW